MLGYIMLYETRDLNNLTTWERINNRSVFNTLK